MLPIRTSSFSIILIISGLLSGGGSRVQAQTTQEAAAPPLSIVQKLKESGLTIEDQVSLFFRLKEEDPDAYTFGNEDELNMYGYDLLWNNQTSEAIEIFKMIVAAFPKSSNAYDSLGEAYLKEGDTELALLNYRKSLELNPENYGAEDQIDRILYPEKALEKPVDRFAKVYSVNEYREDLDQLSKMLREIHPNVFKFTSEKDFKQLVDAKKAMINEQTSYGEFAWLCSEIIATVNCSHTSLGGFMQESKMLPPDLCFPLQTRWVNEQLFVIGNQGNEDKVQIKDEIVSINGRTPLDIMEEIYRHISTQGFIETTKKHMFNIWSTKMIPYAMDFPATYEIVVKGKNEPILLNKAEYFEDLYNDPSVESCDALLCLEILEDHPATAVLTVSSFDYYYWGNYEEFEHFIDSSFSVLREQKIENLIIDVRFNGGGSAESSIYLLRHLINKPFIYLAYAADAKVHDLHEPVEEPFTGQLYFIIDGYGNSTTGHFMSIVKQLHLGTIVGEELGSNQFCTAAQQKYRLSHTKLEYYVAQGTWVTGADSQPDDAGIQPDHVVVQSIDDYLNHVDVVKEYTLKLIPQ